MKDPIHIEAEVLVHQNDIDTLKRMLIDMDKKFDGMQSVMNKLHEVFVTQKELDKFALNVKEENAEIWKQLKEDEKAISRLTFRAAVISGIGIAIAFLKDVILDAFFKGRT